MVARLAVDAANGPVADRGPFCLGCSLPALDVVSHRHCIALVCLRLRDAVAFAESLKPDKSLSAPRADKGRERRQGRARGRVRVEGDQAASGGVQHCGRLVA